MHSTHGVKFFQLKSGCLLQAPATAASSAVPAGTESQQTIQIVDGKFSDYRWINGSWNLESSAFKGKEGKVDWDLVRLHKNPLHPLLLQSVMICRHANYTTLSEHACSCVGR